jgi:hypothetical protein
MIYLTVYLSIGLLYCLGYLTYSYFFEKDDSVSFEKKVSNFFLGVIVGSLVWPFLVYTHVNSYLNPPFEPKAFTIKEKDLIEALSVSEVENKEIIYDPFSAVLKIPFGHLNNKWEEFKMNNSPFTLWSFKPEYEDYSGVVIKEGYAKLEEDGSIKTFFIHQDYRKPTK